MSATAVAADLSGAQLESALDAFRAVVGAEHVLTGEDASEFRDPFWYRDWPQYDASAVVQPATLEEVQAIVRLANEHRVPIWTTSQGRNNGYGGSSPRVQGSVVMNLRRMNRVLEIEPELGYAVVEPGVKWTDLYEAITEKGLPVDALHPGSRVGERDRQLARARDHLHALRRRLPDALRDRGRDRRRRAAANRDGRDAGQQVLAPVPAGPRADA